ncbi:hypothetical protein Pst134EA_024253 [Puccinia striiformis f. sp. tritici]|uniref:hypothetical protein n=1 Tax=Puccinia striiformis f. sp. tritici TaxID=168172 RepID=UPI002007CFF6|nr:hypothetical protein Pst134EA_024253 [Puccinia striiformis f. sp. tritici]KAH9453376.1 hypothetical protein Pst134EA_024253 [Puccinia striiformis f. sp. tritici]
MWSPCIFNTNYILKCLSTKCWNTIPSSNSRKRKNFSLTNLNSQDHKRLACQPLSDVTFNSNSIDLQSTTDLAESSEFLLDHQTSRSNNEHHATTQNQEPHLSQPNDSIRPRLLERISLPLKDNSHIVSYIRKRRTDTSLPLILVYSSFLLSKLLHSTTSRPSDTFILIRIIAFVNKTNQ